ncbi:MAG: hypothetical protein WBD74_06650 [Candidatus Aquilonibacter sp.]
MNDRFQARIGVFAAVALYIVLPARLTIGPVWVVPALVAVILIPLVALAPTKLSQGRLVRALSILLCAVLTFFNVVSVLLLINDLVNSHAPGHGLSAQELLEYGGAIWLTNIIVFALWYWELDGEGPFDRDQYASACVTPSIDFLFQQMLIDPKRITGVNPATWRPQFLDYLYLSFTNALAVSPTDTMPLTRAAKMLMLGESLISFITVALILARSVNILS